MSMDVFRALANFSAENHASSALDLKKGELFEVIDVEEEREQHEWWGVRRLEDNAVGFAPAKYLKFEQKMARELSPEPEKSEDEDGDDMDRENETLPDLYKLPPMDVKPIDDWKPSEDAAGDIPAPDYSDDDDDDADADAGKHKNEDPEQIRERKMKQSIKKRLDELLSPDEWDKVVAVVENEEPEPDYNEADVPNGSSAYKPADGSGLVAPRKLANPVLESKERQDLHRELLMNQKFGVDVLHRKSELKKEMEKRKEAQKKKQMEEYHRQKRTSFEKKLEEQAQKLKLTDEPTQKPIREEPRKEQAEFMRVHSKISRSKTS